MASGEKKRDVRGAGGDTVDQVEMRSGWKPWNDPKRGHPKKPYRQCSSTGREMF